MESQQGLENLRFSMNIMPETSGAHCGVAPHVSAVVCSDEF
jgi:hypothetical protein